MKMTSLPDVPRMPDPGLYELLQAMRRQTLAITREIVEAGLGGAPGASEATAERDPPSLVLDYGGGVEDYLADTEANDLYVRDGEFSAALARESFIKAMDGRGLFLLPDRAIPANFGFMATKPDTFAVQGLLGWFRGDQKFTDGGEWKIIGPNVRTYDVNARYFE